MQLLLLVAENPRNKDDRSAVEVVEAAEIDAPSLDLLAADLLRNPLASIAVTLHLHRGAHSRTSSEEVAGVSSLHGRVVEGVGMTVVVNPSGSRASVRIEWMDFFPACVWK